MRGIVPRLALVMTVIGAAWPGVAEGQGMTLFPEPVRRGEVLRFVVSGVSRAHPDTASVAVRTYEAGDLVTATRELEVDGLRWVRIEGGAWVAAAYVDRFPEAVAGSLEPGREGLSGGRILPWNYRPSLVRVPDSLLPLDMARDEYLRADALRAFARLIADASRRNLRIRILSAWRGAALQAELYAAQLADKGVGQNVSAAPGRSEHQLGTTVDIAVPGQPYLRQSLANTPEWQWILGHASEYGIVATFSRERFTERGVAWEPWHLRYVGRRVDDETGW